MIDLRITFEDDELLYGDYEKISLVSKILFKNVPAQFKTKTA